MLRPKNKMVKKYKYEDVKTNGAYYAINHSSGFSAGLAGDRVSRKVDFCETGAGYGITAYPAINLMRYFI